jgi:hypothetical protein
MNIKKQMKQFLVNTGLWYPLNLMRKLPETIRWIRSDGCSGVAPHTIKMVMVASYLNKFSIEDFVETGTYLGDTLGYIATRGVRCTSIELSEELFQAARKRFNTCKNIKLLQGDSGQRLPELLNEINKPVLFWLDGHYSSGITASAEANTPICTELKAILSHTVKKHVILIDDARCFDGTNGYPYLDDLLREIREEGNYCVDVSADIIRLVPCAVPTLS